jgi:hypothetical protein
MVRKRHLEEIQNNTTPVTWDPNAIKPSMTALIWHAAGGPEMMKEREFIKSYLEVLISENNKEKSEDETQSSGGNSDSPAVIHYV